MCTVALRFPGSGAFLGSGIYRISRNFIHPAPQFERTGILQSDIQKFWKHRIQAHCIGLDQVDVGFETAQVLPGKRVD